MSLSQNIRVLVAAGSLLACNWGTAAASQAGQAPIAPTSASTSLNWSGYVSQQGPFDQVSADWTEPTGNCTSEDTFSSYWVGLDGAGSRSVEQTGAEVDCVGGQAVYYGWYEMYPKPLVRYGKGVRPGDQMSASVTTDNAGDFTLILSDITRGWTKTQLRSNVNAKRHSAEVITEAPAATTTGVLPLTNFGTVSFTNAEANGAPLGGSNPFSVSMVTPGGVVKAAPSALSADGGSFQVAWQHN